MYVAVSRLKIIEGVVTEG